MRSTYYSQATLQRSLSVPCVPPREYSVSERKIQAPTISLIVDEPVAEKVQKFSELTPVYAPRKAVYNAQPTRSVGKNIEFTHHVQIAKNHSATLRRSTPVNEQDILDLVEAHIEDIDLDRVHGNFDVIESSVLCIDDNQLPTRKESLRRYFEPENMATSIQSEESQPKAKKKLKHIARLSVVVLLVGTIGLWTYLFTDTSTSQHANALAIGTSASNATPTPVDPASYTPKFLTISKLNINAAVTPVTSTTTGAMGVPEDIWNAGWYSGSAKPGQPGAVFMDGHASSTRGALFGNLDTLVVGDDIQVERADGKVISYRVAEVIVVNRNDVDMAKALKPLEGQKTGLNIMSCVGQWIAAENTLENRVIVYAVGI